MKNSLFIACGVGLVAASWLAVVGMTPRDPQVAASLNVAQADSGFPAIAELAEYSIQSLSLPTAVGEPFDTFVTLDGEEYYLTLRGKSLRADDFRLLVQYDDEQLHRVEPPNPRTYKGLIEGVPGGWVAGSVFDDGLSLTVALPDGRRYEIAPLAFYVNDAGPSDQHVVFRSRDSILTTAWSCATDTSGHQDEPPAEEGDAGGISGTTTKVIDVSYDTDAEFYVLNGSSVTNTLFDIENVTVRVENVYESEVNATYEVTTIIVRTNASTDPYTTNSSSGLLNEFDNHWSSTKADVRRDVAHMMTGRNNLDGGGTLGIAFLNNTCNMTGAYGLSASRFTTSLNLRACVTAHEIGHNFNASHCSGNCSSGADCRIMCPCVNGCAPQDCLNFGASEQSQINAKIASSSCLQNEALPVAAPFFDDFPSGTISAAKWAYIDGVLATNTSVSPPSGTIALQINANASTEFGDDEIRSTFILLGGLPSVTVSYYTEARGVEAGEQLVVEYWAANLRWIELARYTATGTDENAFTLRSHLLTGTNALHNEFRLRFRAEVDQANDNWWVDDVSVSSAGAAFALNVESEPVDGAAILVAPNDVNGQAGGVTPFTRTYTTGAAVTLIAPGSLNSVPFERWSIDGVDQPVGQTTINTNMTAARTCIAKYPEPTFALEVTSLPFPGANIQVNPADENGQSSGATPFTREYTEDTVVILQAPLSHNGNDFVRWVIDGVNGNGSHSVNFAMTGDRTAEAVYAPPVTERTLSVNSTPSTGVTIAVSPLDNSAAGDGATNFQRFYNDGAEVTLTAPNRTSTLTFRRWTVGGVDQPVDQLGVQITISADETATAVYRLIGDANCDGTVDFFDIDPFLMALFDAPAYVATFCNGSTDTVDADGSGIVDFFDIDAFLDILF